MQRGLIEPADDGHALTDAGSAVAGRKRPAPPEDVQPVDNPDDLQLLEGIPLRPSPSSPPWWWRCADRRARPTCN
jgi:hypothetical protein